MIDTTNGWRSLRPDVSLTRPKNLNLPGTEGGPETTPVAGSMVNPVGATPLDMSQAYGRTPPVASIFCRYAFSVEPSGKLVVVITSWSIAGAHSFPPLVPPWAIPHPA